MNMPPYLSRLGFTTDFNSNVTVTTAHGAPQRVNGRMAASKYYPAFAYGENA